MSTVLTDTINIPGRDLNNKTAVRANLDTERVLRRSYRPLWILHKAGFTLKGNFVAENFIVDSEQSVKMYGIHISRFNMSDGEKDHDRFIEVVLQDVFFREPVPNDIRQWLKLIGRGIAAYEYLICHHISLMEPYQAVDCFISLYNIFQDLESDDPALYKLVISWMDNYDNWQAWDSKCVNDLMSAARSFRHPKSKERVLYHNDIRGVLKLVRDCLEHPARRFRDRFTLVVNDEFPELLMDFQEVMFDVGLLQRLRHDALCLENN